jgi:hypothetical protein
LSNRSDTSSSVLRSSAIASCRSSFFVSVTRSLPPSIGVSILSFAPLIAATILLATDYSMPCLTLTF